jgi:hypothetical protein
LRSSALECPFCWLIWKAGANASHFSWDTKVSVKWEEHGFYAMGSAATRIVFLTEETAETPYGFGRLVQQKMPEELPRNWLRTCEEYHEKCKPLPLRFGPVPGRPNQVLRFLRVIDVHEERLVEISTECRYVGLSYVWGQTASFKLLKENLATLSEKGGLKATRAELAQTIKDAMRLVSLLGERYLWIDALCLVQDDPVDMSHGIENMDIIYEGALMTVIAANGRDQTSGLTGINDTKRQTRQIVREVMPGVKLAITKGVYDYLARAHYSTRGWT